MLEKFDRGEAELGNRCAAAALLGLLAAAYAGQAAGGGGAYVGQPMHIYSDPGTAYEVAAISGKSRGIVTIMTKRSGRSGISYTRRECDCDNGTGRMIGDGASKSAALQNRPAEPFYRLSAGSISAEVCAFACEFHLW